MVLLADSFAVEVMTFCTLGISEDEEGDSFTLHRGYIRKEHGVPAAFCQSHRKKLILHNGISTTVTEGDFQNSSKKLTPREGLKEGNPIPQRSRQEAWLMEAAVAEFTVNSDQSTSHFLYRQMSDGDIRRSQAPHV